MNIAVVGDIHIRKNTPKDHLTAAGNIFVQKQPDAIVLIGDAGDFPSLSSYDKFKRSGQNQYYYQDAEATREGLGMLLAPIQNYNRSRKKKYNPDLYITLGNHEQGRWDRALNDDPTFYGSFNPVEDMGLIEYGFQVTPFKRVLELEGVCFSHYFPSGNMDRAISGANVGRSLILKNKKTSLQGHSHLLNIVPEMDISGKTLWGGSVGCFIHPDQFEEYASQPVQRSWWRGLVFLDNVSDGDFSHYCMRMEDVMKCR